VFYLGKESKLCWIR